jgi:hypothetical protein
VEDAVREAILKELERRIDQLWKQADIPHMDQEDRQRLTGRCNGLIDFHSWILAEAIAKPAPEVGELVRYVRDGVAENWKGCGVSVDRAIQLADALSAAESRIGVLTGALEGVLSCEPTDKSGNYCSINQSQYVRARAALAAKGDV